MAFSINPLEFLKLLSEREKMSREHVFEWLECVQRDARELSNVWLEIEKAIRTAGAIDGEHFPDSLTTYLFTNWSLGEYLIEFYRYASLALGKSLKKNQKEVFIHKLSRAIDRRNITRQKALEMANDFRRGILLTSPDEDSDRVRKTEAFEESVAILQSELAALVVFIETMKVM
ncbi:MAG TPA: hypothetical protein VJN93_10485 [Candidatus Acidoferrum sp.]|nr:hypothetical protein [Candidatus Acidoferrum sp.]